MVKHGLTIYLLLLASLGIFSSHSAATQYNLLSEEEKLQFLMRMPRPEIREIDRQIVRGLSTKFSTVSKSNVIALIQLREKHCPGSLESCMKYSTWAQWSCIHGFENFTEPIGDLWSTVISQVTNEAQAQKIFKDIQACSSSKSLGQTMAALILLEKSIAMNWTDSREKILSWLKFALSFEHISSNFFLETLNLVLDSVGKIKPLPSSVLLPLAHAGLDTYWKMNIEKSEDSLNTLYKALSILDSAGEKFKVFSEIERLLATTGDALYKEKIFLGFNVLYCSAALDLNRVDSCLKSIEKFQKNQKASSKEHLFAKFDYFNALFIQGKIAESIKGFDAVIQAAQKSQNSRVVMWTQLRKALAEAYDGNFSAAQRSKLAFLKNATEDARAELEACAAMIDIWNYRINKEYAKGWKVAEQALKQYKKIAMKPSYVLTLIEYQILLLALDSKNTDQIRRSANELRTGLVKDKSQDFFRLAASMAEKVLAEESFENEKEQMASLVGEKNPYYKDFIKTLYVSAKIKSQR